MKALLAQVVLVIFYCTNITVAIKTNDVNLCKRQPFRGRCPAADGKGPARSQFVLRYYMRDNECISYPFGHCANDENEPVLYRYKEECEKACLNKWPTNDQSTTIQNDHEIEKSANSLISSEITDNDKDNDNDNDNGINVQISTTSSSFPIIDNNNNNNNNNNTATISSQRAAFIAQKSTSHKLLTECEKRRQASESGLIKSDFIPICATDGTFRPLQCETQRENCFCVDHNGVKIPNSDSNGTKKPDCKRIIKAQKSLIYECLSPMDSGPCNTAIKRWYYDTRERQCIKFEYSGCGGNGNNYPTKEACEKQCKSTSNEPKCKGGLQPLRNENDQLVNCTESTCPNGYLCSVAQLGSVCCPINASSSATTNICQLPKERGPCDQYELRFYYNNRLGECKYFFFGGCEGNANNFERVEECERICRQRGVKITATSIVSAPQLITSGPQMRKLNKEFGIKNIKKTGEEKELVELISNDNDDNDDDDDDSAASTNISNDIKNINNDNTADTTTTTTTDNNNEANLEITSSTTIFHDGSMINKNLSAKSSINQSKSHQLQKIDQNIEKKIKQKGAKLSLDSNHTDKITDFTTVKTKNTIATIDKSEKFTTSNRNEQKLASESVAITTDQQLSQSDEEMKIITSTTKTTVESLSDTFMSTALASSIALSPSTIIITTTSQSILSTTAQPTANSNDRCFQKFDRGTCTGQFIRWYWDFEKSTCQVFTYSGCGGNGNNYRSREDCFAACHQPPQPTPKLDNICEHSIHPGDCTGIFQRFAFDSTINDCRPFTYTGCGGNGNNFGSSLECRNRCIVQKPTLSTDVCKHPIEVGECSGVFPRFAYDLVANECRPFTYGGCGGNGNNFGSMLECKTKCVQGSDELVKCPTIDASLCVEPCILFTNRQGCHECKCPIAHSEIDNEPIEPSVITSTLISDKSSDESKSLEAEQFIENKVEKKHGSMSHSGRTSQTNSVTELGEKCSQPMDAGPCKNFIERWFFNINTSLCQSFQYGGCAGNRNHFFSKHECEIHCARFFSARARGTHRKHAITEQMISSSSEEFSHESSISMHTNTPEYKDQKLIASNADNEMILSVTPNNIDTITKSINDNAISITQEQSDEELDMDSNDYKIIDKIDSTSLIHDSLTTIIPITTISSNTPVMENIPLSFATLNSSAATNNNHSIRSSLITTIPAFINETSTFSDMITKSNPNPSQMIISESTTIASNRVDGSFESSTSSQPQFLSQPIPSDKSWLYESLQSIINSQVLSEQQEELSEKKLSFGSFNTSASNVEQQAKKPIKELEKESEEDHYFNVDSSIFMNATNFQNPSHTIISHNRIENNGISTMIEQLNFPFNETKEMKKERSEGKIGTMNLSPSSLSPSLSSSSRSDSNINSGNTTIHPFVSAIQELSEEMIASNGEINSNSQSNALLNQKHSVNTVDDYKLHSLKHKQSQQSLPENHNDITGEQFTVAHDAQFMVKSIPYRTTIKQGEINEILKDQTTMNDAHEEEVIMESEILNQQNITTDSQVMQVTTPHAVVHAVTSLQLENDEICLLPPDAGPCHDYVLRWFHNSQTAKCEQFSYSSCGGNNNNFPDRHTCEAKCSHDNSIKSQLPERCTYKKDEGYSNGYNVKWYFNVRNLRCEQMVYKGQGGNSNQFETLGECQTFCIPLDDKVPEMDTTAKQIAHSLKSTSVDVHQRGFAASQDPENEQQQQQQALSITETDKMSEGQHHVQDITQNTNERHRSSIVSDKNSINVEKIQPINSKQLLTQTITPAELIPQNLDRSASETINARESSKQQLLSSFNDQNSKQISGKEINNAKTFGATIVNKNNDAIVDLPNIFDDISHTPSCPNGHKPIQHADGRPMMCLPGRNQCAGNSLCYFNGVDFFCCPNAEDPYDEHVFGGYGGEEVKRGYKNVKKTPINGNELIVRKLRLRREAQMSSNRPLAMNVAARIDSKVPKYSLARASFAVNNSSDTRQITNICMQDVNTGKCTEAHLRFFYDRRVNTCRLFYYSGCGGNENNFATEEECQQQCKSDKAYDEDVSPGSCPYGEPPLGDNAPVICGKDAGSFECPKGYYCRMGPPNVCCLEKLLPVSEKILVTKKHHENIRFAQPKVKTSENVGYQFDEKQKENDAENSPLAITSTNICPDGTDALLDESTQQPLKCGLGYDGQSFCPVGYYCSIDSEKNGRLCCQLGVVGVKIPPPPKIPPYFGLRPSNPGEIIPRGSLPSDYVSLKQQATGISNTAEPSEQYQSHLDLSGKKLTMNVQPISDSNRAEEDAIEPSENLIPSDEQTTDSSGNVVPSDSKLQDDIYGRMMLKSNDQAFRTQALYNAINNVASPEAENNEVQIDIGEMKDPFESLEYAQKSTSDRSICLLKPSEGRTCREDESPPRTNLQYFYSNRDKRCKLYFYRGCGGSQNRFDTKRHCELTCAGV
uniref:BMA-MLT-11, isoform a n=1 Tax=Brugia malayi TaxID=6279 RepID=A0A0J9XKZ1_BRUMA|nr:BMA-MLT-11, isoform a [Brugia malayi]